MSKELDAAIKHMTTTYKSLAEIAVEYQNSLNAKEVAGALAKAKPDTAEFVALNHLNQLLSSKAIPEVSANPSE